MANEREKELARAVLSHGPLPRSALTSYLGLSAASLTRLAKPLLDQGLLVELEDVGDGSVGRPTRPLDVAPDLGSFVGVKLTGDRLYAVVTDVRATPLDTHDEPLRSADPDGVLEQVAAVIEGWRGHGLRGIGLSLGGVVRDGVVLAAPFLGWRDVPLGRLLEARVAVPVSVENDVVALAEAERWFGAGRGIPGFAVVTIGAGVGYGLVVGGAVVRTADAGAGTGGHIPLDPLGPRCSEGHRGCAQAMLTIGSITAQVSAALQRQVGYEEVLELAAAGVPAAAEVTTAAGEALGRLLSLATNLTLQPHVVLAGEGAGLFALVEQRVRTVLASERDPRATPVQIHLDASGFHGWARGAAAVAVQAAVDRIAIG